MGLMLNFGNSFRVRSRFGHANGHIHDMRQQVRWTRNVGYLESPNAHITTAVLTFFLGLAAAQVWLNLQLRHDVYDMTPTGTIITKSDRHAVHTTSCTEKS